MKNTMFFMLTILLSGLCHSSPNYISELNVINEENDGIGGLSGLSYDAENGFLYAVSDGRNKSKDNMAKIYKFNLNLEKKEVVLLSSKYLVDGNGESFLGGTVDAEGLAFIQKQNQLYYTSEIAPALRKSSTDGKLIDVYDHHFPNYYNVKENGKNKSKIGLRNNKSFEGLSITPDGKYLYIATEAALIQDGELSDSINGSNVRILKFLLSDKGDIVDLLGEYAYQLDPLRHFSEYGYSGNGLSEILAIAEDKLIAIERNGINTSPGFEKFKYYINLYNVDFKNATNLIGMNKISGKENYVNKEKLLELNDVILNPDNIESITFGPSYSGKRTLILATDNNYSKFHKTKFYLFEY